MAERWVTEWSRPTHSGGNSSTKGGIHFHPDSISMQILPHEVWSSFLSRLCWQTPEVVLTGEFLGWLSTANLGSQILSWKIWPGWAGLCKKLPIVMHILEQEVRQGWTGAHRAYSHIFHWYRSHMAGFHEIAEAVHCIWQCLTEEMHNNVDERAGYVLWWWCTVYYDEKDVQYAHMFTAL